MVVLNIWIRKKSSLVLINAAFINKMKASRNLKLFYVGFVTLKSKRSYERQIFWKFGSSVYARILRWHKKLFEKCMAIEKKNFQSIHKAHIRLSKCRESCTVVTKLNSETINNGFLFELHAYAYTLCSATSLSM